MNFNVEFNETNKAFWAELSQTIPYSYRIYREYRVDPGQRTAMFDYFSKNMKYDHSGEWRWYFSKTNCLIDIHWNDYEKNVDQVDRFEFTVLTDHTQSHEIVEDFEQRFGAIQTTKFQLLRANWAYLDNKGQLEYTSLPVNKLNVFHAEMYPFIGDVDQYIDDFIKSPSSILILTGDPGLGKSTFIKYLLARTRWRATLAYDETVMKNDELYLDFIKGSEEVLILEDADNILRSRLDDGNKIMSKLLNVSDGILDISGKKFIFTANLENVRDIDSALIRPGRCYDVKMFRPLTMAEAKIAAEKINKTLHSDKDEFTVAEIFQGKDMKSNAGDLHSGMGFK